MNGNMIGRVFNNRYQLTERVGVGGMAEVYRAQDRVLGRVVAVKVMLPQYAADAEFTQRFRQEAASAANLQSPYIVNVYDWGQDEGTYYIVMEFVRGSDLKTAIQQRGPVNQRKVAEIGAQVCKALSVAHGQDIIHRDIKPQNIMIQPDGNVKVMDFGIARAKNSVKTATGAVLGTAHYISPEQAQGKELTAASDIYSLGVVMYEAVTGQLPFDGPDSVSVAMKQVSELPVPPSQVNPNVDPALEAIILRAMEKAPEARFATVGDMKNALNDYLAGRSVDLGGRTAPYDNYAQPIIDGGTSVMPVMDQKQQQRDQRNMVVDDEPVRRGPSPIAIVAVAALVIAAIAFAVIGLGGLGASDEAGTIPDVRGKSVAAATSELTRAGYQIGTTNEVFDATLATGTVVSTDPPAGTKADAGTVVNLNVSKGKEAVTVPNLVGRTPEEAKQLLADAGLVGQEGTSENSETVAEGLVARQDPAADSSVDKGATVRYFLSKGSEMVEVPDLTFMTESQAQAELAKLGLAGSKSGEESSSYVDSGGIVNQDPVGGTKVAKGSTVTYTVSTGAEEVPYVIGYPLSTAENLLAAAGYSTGNGNLVIHEMADTEDAGIVIGQRESADGTVTITVSTGPEDEEPSDGGGDGDGGGSDSGDGGSDGGDSGEEG